MADDNLDIDRLLAKMDAPEPSKDAQDQALAAAMAAFDEKNQKSAQGKGATGRLTGIVNNIGRKLMEKRFSRGGLAGGVAVCALVAVLGMPFITHQMEMLSPAQLDSLAKTKLQSEILVKQAVPSVTSGKREEMESAQDMAAAPAVEPAAPSAPAMRMESLNMAPAGAMAKRAMEPQKIMAAPAIGGLMPAPEVMPSYYQDQGRDKFESFHENGVMQVAEAPVSTFSIDVDTSSYSFMRRQINAGQLPQADSLRVEELVNYFPYNYPVPADRKTPFQPTVTVFDSPWHAGQKLVHIGIKGYQVAEKPRSNLVFLIDTSGSMESPDKLPLLKNAFKLMLDSLQPDDTVAIVTYAGSAGTALEPTKVSDRGRILAALDALGAGGGTAGAAGIAQAYALAEQNKVEGGNNRIILATDGDFNVGASDPEQLKDMVAKKRGEGIYLSVLGFGEGNYNDQMMQALAQNGQGNAAYIDTLNEARKVLVDEASQTLFTIAKDVKIQVEFNPAMVSEYRLVGYETRHLEREDFNNDKVDAGEVGAGAAVTAIYEITPAGGAKAVDDLRYGDKAAAPAAKPSADGEYAFLKIRYKQPDADQSQLIERAITAKDEVTFDQASDDARFATAVAGFGQLLRGGTHAGTLTYDQVIAEANGARGADEYGYRSEFVNLVRLAKQLQH